MQAVTTIGLDIAKSIFQIHGVDAAGNVIVRRKLKRRYVLPFFQRLSPCLIGIEACAWSHHWSRELQALGHTVRLMPAKDVKAYIKRNKNDAADAEAICEAVRRPTMRFVGVKLAEQQGRLMQHRTRDLLVRQRRAAPCRTCLPTWRAETIAWLNGLISAVVADLNAPHIVTHPADFLPDAHRKAVGEKRREPS